MLFRTSDAERLDVKVQALAALRLKRRKSLYLPGRPSSTKPLAVGIIAALVLVPVHLGFLRDYTVLLSSLTAYGVSAAVCVLMSFRSKERFDFAMLAERLTHFHAPEKATRKAAPGGPLGRGESPARA